MNSESDELHPNWRALATIHLPLKRFIKAGEESLGDGATNNCDGRKYEIKGVDGQEIKVFYEELITEQPKRLTKRNFRNNEKKFKATKELHEPKIPFDKNKFFRCAQENDANTLKKFELKSDDINSSDGYGWTALMIASCENALKAVQVLLQLGADQNIKDKCGKTALELARQKGHIEIVSILENKETLEKVLEVPSCSQKETEKTPKAFYCESCKRNFSETSSTAHQTSTLHQFNLKSTQPPNKLQRFNISNKNRGLQLMVKQGWDKESGLGPSKSGRLYPVKTVIRKQRTGLGIEQSSARVSHYKAFDASAVKRSNSDYYKKKPRNRNDTRREKVREWKRNKRLRNELS